MTEDPDPEGYGPIVAALAELPPNTEIRWIDSAIGDQKYATVWSDIYAPVICEKAGLGWAWTILLPDDANEPGQCEIVVPPTYVEVCEELDGHDYNVLFAASLIHDDPLHERHLKVAEECEAAGRKLVKRLGWDTDTISAALAHWVKLNTGRDDITFKVDYSILDPMLKSLEQSIQGLETGAVDAVQIGDGVFAHPDALDALLKMDPDAAAEGTAFLQQEVYDRRNKS